MIYQVDLSKATEFLHSTIEKQVNEEEQKWIDQQELKLRDQFQLRSFYLAFSSAPRFISKAKLNLTQEELTQAVSFGKASILIRHPWISDKCQ